MGNARKKASATVAAFASALITLAAAQTVMRIDLRESLRRGAHSFADFDAPRGTDATLSTCPISGQPRQNSAALLELRVGLSALIFLNEFEQPGPAP